MSSPTSPEEIRWLVNELYAAWSLHEPHRIDAIFTDDAIYSDIAGGKNQQGKQEIKQLLRAAFEWAPDFRVTMSSLTVGTDAAANRMGERRHPNRAHRRPAGERQHLSPARRFNPRIPRRQDF